MSPDYNGSSSSARRDVDRVQNTNTGAMFVVVLFAVFVVLKLAPPVQDWSWWWVTAPLWIPFALGLLITLGKAATK